MRGIVITLLAFGLAVAASKDVVCRKETSKTVWLQAGDSFGFKTQPGRNYKGPVKCIVNYKLGRTCKRVTFSCAKVNIFNKDPYKCMKGDRLVVRAAKRQKRYCGRKNILRNARGHMKVSFYASKKGQGTGASCTVKCSSRIPPTTIPPVEDVSLLLIGGWADGSNMDSCEVYGSPTCDVPDLPVAVSDHSAFYFEKQVISCGGEDNTPTPTCYKLEPESGWTFHSNMSNPHITGSVVIVESGVYILGGHEEPNKSDFMASGTSVWTSGPDIPGDKVENSCAVALSGEMFVVIGGGDIKNQVREYDGSSWTNWSNLTVPRESHACTIFEDGIIVAGGIVNGVKVASTEIINVVTKTSEAGPDMAIPRAVFSFHNVNGQLMIVVGEDVDVPVNSVEIFDPSTGSTMGQDATLARAYHASLLVPQSVLKALIGCY